MHLKGQRVAVVLLLAAAQRMSERTITENSIIRGIWCKAVTAYVQDHLDAPREEGSSW